MKKTMWSEEGGKTGGKDIDPELSAASDAHGRTLYPPTNFPWICHRPAVATGGVAFA